MGLHRRGCFVRKPFAQGDQQPRQRGAHGTRANAELHRDRLFAEPQPQSARLDAGEQNRDHLVGVAAFLLHLEGLPDLFGDPGGIDGVRTEDGKEMEAFSIASLMLISSLSPPASHWESAQTSIRSDSRAWRISATTWSSWLE